jgi:hypothetical protein
MSLFYTEKTEPYSGGDLKVANAWFVGVLGFVVVVAALVVGNQWFKVFAATQTGKAEYAQADQNRQITIVEAEAANAAATSRALATVKIAQAEAQAEVERAKGVAQANVIIGDSLKGNEGYLRYLYITGLAAKAGQIIYVPTEAGLPILEAGKR